MNKVPIVKPTPNNEEQFGLQNNKYFCNMVFKNNNKVKLICSMYNTINKHVK